MEKVLSLPARLCVGFFSIGIATASMQEVPVTAQPKPSLATKYMVKDAYTEAELDAFVSLRYPDKSIYKAVHALKEVYKQREEYEAGQRKGKTIKLDNSTKKIFYDQLATHEKRCVFMVKSDPDLPVVPIPLGFEYFNMGIDGITVWIKVKMLGWAEEIIKNNPLGPAEKSPVAPEHGFPDYQERLRSPYPTITEVADAFLASLKNTEQQSLATIKKLLDLVNQDKAATIIQSRVRGMQDRAKFESKKAVKVQENEVAAAKSEVDAMFAEFE